MTTVRADICSRTRIVRWSTAAALLAGILVYLVVLATPASAHAVLVEADPADFSELDEAPDRVSLSFNEPIELSADSLRVFDANAERIDDGMLESSADSMAEVALPTDLPDGGYVVTYRVISADSHPVAGVLQFTVGDADEVSDEVVAELFGGSGQGGAGMLGPALRGLGYVATLIAAGAVLYAMVVARSRPDIAAARTLGTRAALAGIVLALLAVPVQGVAVLDVGYLEALTPSNLGEVFTSSFGISSLVRAGALGFVALLWRPGIMIELSAVVGLSAVGSYVLDGHQRSMEPSWLLIAGDLIHVFAASIWFAGLVLLIGALRRRSDADSPLEAASLVARFSSMALWAVVAVGIGGVAMSVPLVGSLGALTSTTYGWLLIAKVAAVGVVVLVAAYNRQRLVPAIARYAAPTGGSTRTRQDSGGKGNDRVDADEPDADAGFKRAWSGLYTTMRIEAAIIVAVLLLTGVLVSIQPASDAAGMGGLYETTASFGDDHEIDLVVDPNRVGTNTMHVYILDETGRPSDEIGDIELELTYVPEQIGPIPIELFYAGPGHWIANVDDLAFPGQWEVVVIGAEDRFSEVRTTVNVPVAQ